jgi:hypothetical protein
MWCDSAEAEIRQDDANDDDKTDDVDDGIHGVLWSVVWRAGWHAYEDSVFPHPQLMAVGVAS